MVGERYVKTVVALVALPPSGFTTRTWTVPLPGGVSTFSEVPLAATLTGAVCHGPKSTSVTPARSVPLMIIAVPPADGARTTLMPVMAGPGRVVTKPERPGLPGVPA